MSFTQFPKDQYFRFIDTDTITSLGYFNLKDGTDLNHMMITILQVGVIASPYQARIKVYGSSVFDAPIFSSDWAVLSVATLDPTYSTNWIGNIYFDFAGQPFNPNIDYHFAIETSGYTRTEDVFELGVNLDWYSEVNNQLSGPDNAGARIRILGTRP